MLLLTTSTPLPPCAGTPAKPVITLAAGGSSLTARINYTRVFTATSYVAVLTDVNDDTNTLTDSMAVADTEEGPWSRTLTAPGKGTYRFTVTMADPKNPELRIDECPADEAPLGATALFLRGTPNVTKVAVADTGPLPRAFTARTRNT